MKISVHKVPVHLNLNPGWSADKKKFRQEIKLDLTKKISQKKYKNYFSSVSHTRGLGGFALCLKPVGLDIELAKRSVSERAFHRLSTPLERELGLNPISMWVAKEAAWKALKGPHQPTTISQIEIIEIRKMRSSKNISFRFKVRNSNKMHAVGRGRLYNYGRFILGIALLNT